MSPTETSLLGKESDSLWQLEGVPYRTSFSNLMSPATRRCVAHLNYRAKHRDSAATTRFPGTGWGIVREGVIPITNTLVAMHRELGSCCEVLHHCVSIQLCGASWISGLLFRAERGKRREKRRGEREETSRLQRKLVYSWDSWPPANMATSTGYHLPGGEVDGFCLNSSWNPI